MRLGKPEIPTIASQDFKILSQKIEKNIGIEFEVNKKMDLERSLFNAYKDFGFREMQSFVKFLLDSEFDDELILKFAKYLTIGETYFFRELQSLRLLVRHLQKLNEKGNEEIQIWCAACSTGEEAYSLAMLLYETDYKLFRKVKIVATDINENSIRNAKKGIYREWSFRNTSPERKKEFFTEIGGGNFIIKDIIKNKIDFRIVNLRKLDHYNYLNEFCFDGVLLRNVLIYFDSETSNSILSTITNFMKEGGLLITGVAETLIVKTDKLKPEFEESIKYFIKKSYFKFNEDEFKEELAKKKAEIRARKLKRIVTPAIKEARKKKSLRNVHRIQKTKEETNAEKLIDLYTAGDYDKLIFEFNRITDYDSLNDDIQLLYCKAFANQGKIEDALEQCERILSKNKINKGVHALAAHLYSEEGNYEKALQHLNSALFLDSNDVLLYFLRANVKTKLKDRAGAKKDLTIVVKLLKKLEPDKILDEADGLSAGSLSKITESLLENMN